MNGDQNSVSVVVSNQSFELTPVDIRVAVDDHTVVDAEFDVQGAGLAQHNWKQYRVPIDAGSHRIVAQSQRGSARLERAFDWPGVQSISVAFWDSGRGANAPGGYFTIEPSAAQAASM